VLLQSADFAARAFTGRGCSQITQIQERRQPGVARLTRRVRAVGAAAVDFTISTVPPVKMAWAISEIRVP
jgi:hypothetical protein